MNRLGFVIILLALSVQTVIAQSAGTISASSLSVCAGGSTTLTYSGTTGSAGYNTIWQQSNDNLNGSFTDIGGAAASTFNLTNVSANKYYRIKSTETSDQSQIYSASILIQVIALPNVQVSASPKSISANGTSVVLSGTGGATYSWAPSGGVVSGTNNATYTISLASNTTISVTGTDANPQACTNTASVSLSVLNPGSIGADANVCVDNARALVRVVTHVQLCYV